MPQFKATGSLKLRQHLHEHRFICNRIIFDAVTPSVYTKPIKNIGQTVSIWKRCQKWRNRINLNAAYDSY